MSTKLTILFFMKRTKAVANGSLPVSCKEFNENLAVTRAVTNQILKVTTHVHDEFNSLNHNNIFKEMDRCSFNDAYYLECGRQKGYKIVTDDGDLFKNNTLGIEIITMKY